MKAVEARFRGSRVHNDEFREVFVVAFSEEGLFWCHLNMLEIENILFLAATNDRDVITKCN